MTALDLFSGECGDEQIEIVDAVESVKYYRDETGIHYVLKRTLRELIIKRYTK